MKVIHFMNEAPMAFPAGLAAAIDDFDDVEIIIATLYENVDEEVADSLQVVSLDADGHLDIDAYRRFRKFLITEGPDIVHTHPNATGAVARLVAATTDTMVVDTRHNDHRHFDWYQRLPNIPATLVTDCYISNSENTFQSFSPIEKLLQRITGGRHQVVYNGVDPSQVKTLPPEPADLPDSPRIVSVARYVPQKNHETLVKAMVHIREIIPDASLILIGKGPRFDEVTSLIKRLGLEDAVVQTGYLPQREQVFSTVANADVFAISSWYEGFCIAAAEAMLTGTPIVASDIDVLREVVDEAGLFADPADPIAFADQIVRLLRDDSKRERLGETAAKRARSTFSLNQTAEGYVLVYRNLIDD